MLFTWKWAGGFLEKASWFHRAHLEEKWPLSDKHWSTCPVRNSELCWDSFRTRYPALKERLVSK